LVIVLQNFSIIPFLWSDIYYKGYAGFLSGTLGPNKIVSGMFSLIMSIFAIGLVFNKKIEINKVFVVLVIFINLYVLLLSGSRTSYVGLLVFIVFFSFYKTGSFVFFSISIGSIFAFFIMSNPGLYEKINDVISSRVIDRIEDDQDIENANVGKLYEDLGAGRGKLSMNYINYLASYPEVIPFGMGFNNRITKGFSAHNMYLNIIKELGLVGFVLYFGWLLKYLQISFENYSGYALALKGLIISMLVALFFGEHLYIYRPLFAILGLFLIVVNALISSLHNNES
jgi:O-antigen ligase